MSDDGKLFVGGLNFDTTEDVLEEAFSKYGNILKVDVIRDRGTDKSRGFGFVTFENAEDASDAKEGMNGKILEGRHIRVDDAGKGGSRSGGGFRGGFRGGRGRGGFGYSRGYGERPYGGGRGGYGGGEQRSCGGYAGGYGDRSSGRYGSSGGSGSYRDREQQSYGRSTGSYRDGYDGYPHE